MTIEWLFVGIGFALGHVFQRVLQNLAGELVYTEDDAMHIYEKGFDAGKKEQKQ